jgi:hypothetical protein
MKLRDHGVTLLAATGVEKLSRGNALDAFEKFQQHDVSFRLMIRLNGCIAVICFTGDLLSQFLQVIRLVDGLSKQQALQSQLDSDSDKQLVVRLRSQRISFNGTCHTSFPPFQTQARRAGDNPSRQE